MSKLEDDLKRYSNELFTNGDLKAGLSLAGEILGMVAIFGGALTTLSMVLPMVGIPATGAVAMGLMRELGRAYGDLDERKRKQVRAVVSWFRGGFSLGSRLRD